MSHPLDRFDEYSARVRARLEKAQAWSGDRNFSRPPSDNIAEAIEEIEDTMAWCYLAWTRLEAVRELLAAMPKDRGGRPPETGDTVSPVSTLADLGQSEAAAE